MIPRRVATTSDGHREQLQPLAFLCMQQQQQGPGIIAAAIAIEYGVFVALGHAPLALSLSLCSLGE